MTPEQKQKPATNFDFDDEDVLDDFLSEIREALSEELDMSTAETEDEFSDTTLLNYFLEHNAEERQTAEESILGTARMAAMRFHSRPGSGHELEKSRAMKDDPVGLARDKERFDKLYKKRAEMKAKSDAEMKAVTGK